MSNTNNRLPFKQIGNASLIRPRFSPGLLLQDDDLTAVVDYARDMTRLLFRSMLGCGVLCGFEVKAKFDACANLQIQVQAGVALDCRGGVIEFPKDQTLEIDPECCKTLPSPLWVVIGHKQHSCAPRDVASSPEDDENGTTYTRIRDGYELRVLAERPTGACSCVGEKDEVLENCHAAHQAGKCACTCDCDAVVLARIILVEPGEGDVYEQEVDHSVRRFVRPQLLPDPLVQKAKEGKAPTGQGNLKDQKQQEQQEQKRTEGQDQKQQQETQQQEQKQVDPQDQKQVDPQDQKQVDPQDQKQIDPKDQKQKQIDKEERKTGKGKTGKATNVPVDSSGADGEPEVDK